MTVKADLDSASIRKSCGLDVVSLFESATYRLQRSGLNTVLSGNVAKVFYGN